MIEAHTHKLKLYLLHLKFFLNIHLKCYFDRRLFSFFSRKCKNKWPIEIIDYRGDFCLLRDDFLIRGAFENCLSA